MTACRSCGGRICRGETVCFNCQTPVKQERTKREVMVERFGLAVNILFYLCLVLTVASIFFDLGFRTAIVGAATLVFKLVRQSMGEMTESKG